MTTPAAGDPEAHDGFERVHIELDWWDGPRSGLADVDGAPCYFQSVDLCEPDDEFLVWPASGLALALEREQWAIFVKWNHRYETGSATVDSHPGQGGISARYDELQDLLAPHRAVPSGARRLAADLRQLGSRRARYRLDGPDYLMRWRPGR